MDIGPTQGVGGTPRIESKPVQPVRPPEPAPAAPSDRIEVSETGRLAAEAISLPSVRLEKIAELKHLIESGRYQTDERLLGALEKFLRENPDVR